MFILGNISSFDNLDAFSKDMRTFNLHWAVNKIQNFYLYAKRRRYFINWKNKISQVNDEIRTLPNIGVDYFTAMEHFKEQQTIEKY